MSVNGEQRCERIEKLNSVAYQMITGKIQHRQQENTQLPPTQRRQQINFCAFSACVHSRKLERARYVTTLSLLTTRSSRDEQIINRNSEKTAKLYARRSSSNLSRQIKDQREYDPASSQTKWRNYFLAFLYVLASGERDFSEKEKERNFVIYK